MTRQPPLLLIGFLVVFTAGCAQIPEQELSQYRSAFAEVQQASEEILVGFAEAKEAAEKRVAATDADANVSDAPTPVLFSTELQSFGAKEPEAIEARRTALRTIDKFNNVLVTLAEGKSVEAVQGAAGGFVQAAGKFVAAAAGGAVPGLSAHTLQSIEGRTALLSGLIVELNQVIDSVKTKPPYQDALERMTGLLTKAQNLFKEEKTSLV